MVLEIELKVVKEEYKKTRTERIDKEVYIRVLENEDLGFKVTLESPEKLDTHFNTGETVTAVFKNTQKRLNE